MAVLTLKSDIVLAKVEIKHIYISCNHRINESRDSRGETP